MNSRCVPDLEFNLQRLEQSLQALKTKVAERVMDERVGVFGSAAFQHPLTRQELAWGVANIDIPAPRCVAGKDLGKWVQRFSTAPHASKARE